MVKRRVVPLGWGLRWAGITSDGLAASGLITCAIAVWLKAIDEPRWAVLAITCSGLVELDAVDGRVVGEYTERNPEDWSEFGI